MTRQFIKQTNTERIVYIIETRRGM